jgi:hypothetical protein
MENIDIYQTGTCNKCDGKHKTENCYIYKKDRENHPDALLSRKNNISDIDCRYHLFKAHIVKQPTDGNCLFHSLAYGIGNINHKKLRNGIAFWIYSNSNYSIAGTPLKQWVYWESGKSIIKYSQDIAISGWGGALEMLACSRLLNINIFVYEYKRDKLINISCFFTNKKNKPIFILYSNRVHYDVLIPLK